MSGYFCDNIWTLQRKCPKLVQLQNPCSVFEHYTGFVMPNFYKKIYNVWVLFQWTHNMIKEKGWNIIMSTNEIMPKLKDFLCENLGIDADVLEFDTQLFGDGEIGLDSIDSLEIIAYVDDEFGVQMTGVGKEHFYSIETIAKYIEENA